MERWALAGNHTDVARALLHTTQPVSGIMRLTLVDVAFGIYYRYMTPEEGAERIKEAHEKAKQEADRTD